MTLQDNSVDAEDEEDDTDNGFRTDEHLDADLNAEGSEPDSIGTISDDSPNETLIGIGIVRPVTEMTDDELSIALQAIREERRNRGTKQAAKTRKREKVKKLTSADNLAAMIAEIKNITDPAERMERLKALKQAMSGVVPAKNPSPAAEAAASQRLAAKT